MSQAPVQAQKSTTVRTRLKIAGFRAAFAVLERVAPGPGSRLALDLWCTLPGAGRPTPRRPPRSGRPLDARCLRPIGRGGDLGRRTAGFPDARLRRLAWSARL